MTTTTTTPPTDLRGALIEHAQHRALLAIHFRGREGAACVAIGRLSFVQERHVCLVYGRSHRESIVVLAAIERVERIDHRAGRRLHAGGAS